MAAVIDKTIVGGVTFVLEATDNASEQVVKLMVYLQQLELAYRQMGLSGNQTFTLLDKKLRDLAKSGAATAAVFKELSKTVGKDSPLYKTIQELSKIKFKWLNDTKQINSFQDAIIACSGIMVSFKRMLAPTQEMYAFAERLADINQKMLNMSMNAMESVSRLTAVGNVLRGFGGNANDYGGFKRSFEIEMEKRRRNQGNGGKFTQVLATYGISFDSNNFDSTMKNYVKFFSGSSASDVQKQRVKEMLGLSDAMYRMMSNGWEHYQREIAAAEKRSAASAEAAKKSDSLKQATAKLTAAWEDLKNRALIALAPYIEKIINGLVKFIDSLEEGEKEFWAVVLVVGKVVGALIATAGPFLYAIASIRSLTRWVKELGFAASATSSTPIAGGGGGGGGNFAVNTAKNKSQRIKPIKGISKGATNLNKTVSAASKLGKVAKAAGAVGRKIPWLALAFAGMDLFNAQRQYANGDKVGASETAGGALGGLAGSAIGSAIGTAIVPGIGTVIGGALGWMIGNAGGSFVGEKAGRAMAEPSVPPMPLPSVAELGGNKVDIGNFEMVVNSNASDPKAVAEEVHQRMLNEFGVLASGPAMAG